MSVKLKIKLNPIFHFNHTNVDEKSSSRHKNSKSANKLKRIKHQPYFKQRPTIINLTTIIIKENNRNEHTDNRGERSKQHGHKSIWFDIY